MFGEDPMVQVRFWGSGFRVSQVLSPFEGSAREALQRLFEGSKGLSFCGLGIFQGLRGTVDSSTLNP